MSQSGIIDVAGSNPQIPTSFVADVGIAIPIGNILEILGGSNVTTTGSGNTITIDVAGSFAETITGNTGGALSPVGGNWNIIGSGNITTDGVGNTLTATLTGLTPRAVQLGSTSTTLAQSNLGNNGQVFIGATGANPAFGTLTSTGGTVIYTPGANSLNLETSGSVPIQFTTDSGTATPSLGNLNDLGSGSITTSGSGSTVTTSLTGLTNHSVLVGAGTATITKLSVGSNGQVLIGATTADPAFATLTSSDSSISFTTGANTLSLQVAGGTTVGKTITGDSGGALSPTAGNWNLLGSGSITTAGSGSTLTTQLTGLTNHSVLIGAGTTTITKVAPSATSGVPLISQGASADPVFGTAVVAGGGTGVVSNTAYAVLCGGTTSTNPIQSIASVGSSTQVLTSNGAGALPTFQAASYAAPPYYFYAQLSATAVNATGDGSDFVIKCDTIVKNVGSAYSAATGLFTAPVAGMYHFDANFQLTGIVSTHTQLVARIIQTSPALGISNFVMNPYPLAWNSQINFCLSCTYGLALNATVYIDIIVGGTGKTVSISLNNTNFQGYYVGP